MNNKTVVDGYRTPHTEKLHVTERWSLINDKTLEVKITVEDPDTFNAPLTLRQVDPLIRQLSLYRDLIDRKTGDPT